MKQQLDEMMIKHCLKKGFRWYKNYLIHPTRKEIFKKHAHYGLVEYKNLKLNCGYPYITVGKMSKTKEMLSRAKWKTFKGEIPSGYVVAIKDGNPTNTRLDNYELMPMYDRVSKSNKNSFRKIRCIETGVVYENINEVCEKLLSPEKKQALYKHLNGTIQINRYIKVGGEEVIYKRKTEHVAWLTFEWVKEKHELK